VFGRMNSRFRHYDCIVITLEWNLIFFVGEDGEIIAYDRAVEDIVSSLRVSFGMVDVPLKKSSSADHTISLCSLILRFISKAINKVAYDVSLCHAF
jgi:transposase-like protein